jgi:multidrug transporter EmrE-like cation transporter
MPWLLLIAAIALELFGTTALKLSDGFSKLWWTVGMAIGYGGAFYLLSVAVKTIPLGLAYATWAGIGTLGAVVISTLLFKSDAGLLVWIGAALVIGGVVLMNLGSSSH